LCFVFGFGGSNLREDADRRGGRTGIVQRLQSTA